MLPDRFLSRDTAHLKEDLEASLKYALGDEYDAQEIEAQIIIEKLTSFDRSREALLAVRTRFSNALFGKVILYHLEHKTSLMNEAAGISCVRGLARIGMTVADLGWPDEVLHPKYATTDAAAPESAAAPTCVADADEPAAAEPSAFEQHKAEIFSSLDIMLYAEKDWEGLPPSLLALDEPAKQWIAAALASEGIGKVR